MYTNYFAATMASEFFILLLQKEIHTILSYGSKILRHTHMIFGTVPLVQIFQTAAGGIAIGTGEPGVLRSFFTRYNFAVGT